METAQQRTRWERWAPLVQFVMLGLSTAIAASTSHLFGLDSPSWLIIQAVLVLATFAWSWWWVLYRPTWRQDPLRAAIHFAGRTLLAFALTWINPFFAFFAWVGYLDMGNVKYRSVRYAGIVVLAVTLAGSQSGGLPPASGIQWLVLVILFLINIGLATLVGHFQHQSVRREEEQTAMIAELERTAREKAALQDTIVSQARRAGVQDERARLAREIHDTIAQSLAAVLAQLQAAEHEDNPRARLDRATALVRSALGEARRSVLDLTPAPLDCTSLADAVAVLVQQWEQDHKIQPDLVITGEVRPLHPEIESTVLRIAQETLANVSKHAAANRVGVTLTYDDDQIALDVRDDGTGFIPTATSPTSFGLQGMQQRAHRLAGTLNIETKVGSGTAVSLHLPALPKEAKA